MTSKSPHRNYLTFLFKNGLVQGLGWSFGVTLGFLILSTLVLFLLRSLGALPLIGRHVTPIIETTERQLELRTPLNR